MPVAVYIGVIYVLLNLFITLYYCQIQNLKYKINFDTKAETCTVNFGGEEVIYFESRYSSECNVIH